MSIVNIDFSSVFVSNQISALERALSQSIMKISSGSKLLSSADDPGSMAAQSNFNAHLGGIRSATYNVENIMSLLETADSSLSSMEDGLMIMRDDALKAMNDALLTADEFTALDNEYQLGVAALAQKASDTTFNSLNLLDGTYAGGKTAQVGPYTSASLTIVIPNMVAAVAPLGATNIGDAVSASAALTAVDNALDNIASARATVGSYTKALTVVSDDLAGQEAAITGALDAVEGVDYASEISNFSNLSVISEAATSILASTHKVDEMLVGVLKNMY